MESSNDLESAVEKVCVALKSHANACQFDGENAGAVIGRGEALVDAVLDYEDLLMRESGWTSPMRNLGPRLSLSGEEPARPPSGGMGGCAGGPDAGRCVELMVRYRLWVPNEAALLGIASGKTGTEIGDPGRAVEHLYQCDGWDPTGYLPDLMSVESVTVEATAGT